MNTEKIEKLKKSLSNSKIPADLKPKIEAEIKRLEDLDAKQSEPKVEPKEEEKEVKPVAKKTTTRKPRATKSVAKKTSTRKPSQTSKPKRTAMSVAKEIRKDGESWKDAMARASKVMKEKSKTATKDVETELEKLTKLVRGEKNKEKVSRVSDTNLKRDASRKAKPLGARKVTRSGETSNQYGTYKNHLGRKYVENRDKHGDRLAPRYPKNAPLLAEGGYLTDPTFGNFQTGVFAKGGGVDYYEQLGVYVQGVGSIYKGISMEKAVEIANSYNKKYPNAEIVIVDEKYGDEYDMDGNLKDEYAKGGGIRRKNGQTYDYGRVWTKDHNEFDKGADHEVNYRRKKLAKGGRIESLKKELYRLQRELNSSRLQTYRLGDNSQEAKDRKKEREVKLARFNEVLKELRESDAKFESGGGIPNNYEGKSPKEVWDMWTEKQKQHFLVDHFNHFIVEEFKGKNLIDISRLEYKKLPLRVRLELDFHVNKGQYAKGGGVRTINGREYSYGRNWTNDHNLTNKGEEHEVTYKRKRFELGGNVVTDLAGHTGGGTGGLNSGMPLDGFSNTAYTGLVGETGAMSSGEMFMNGGGLPSGVSQSYMITESLGNPAQHFAKGGGIRRKNGQTYDYGRVWTKDHNEFDKSADHEVNYRRKNKFLGVFAKGGGVKSDKYDGKTEKIVEELKNLKGGLDNKAPYVYQRDGYIYVSAEEGDNYADYDNYLYIDEKLEDFADKYDTYWDWENAGAIILVPLSDEYATGGVMATGGGVNDESPKIYVADLEAYNNGRLSGVWLDLADYNDADELMEAIQDFLKTSGGEEYAIHDVENIPNSMYSEYMGQRDFEELYEMIDLAKQNDLPLSVVQEVVSQYDASAVDEFQGKYNDAEDFAIELVDEMGIENFIDFEYYLEVSDTDKRLLAKDMADSYVENIVDEDGGNRIIEEAGLDLDEYEEAESDRQEEMIDEAREIVYDEYYNNWIEGLSDPYYFLVEEQGLYSAEDFANADFVRIDYEKLADALEQDYTFIYDGGSLYVFNIR